MVHAALIFKVFPSVAVSVFVIVIVDVTETVIRICFPEAPSLGARLGSISWLLSSSEDQGLRFTELN